MKKLTYKNQMVLGMSLIFLLSACTPQDNLPLKSGAEQEKFLTKKNKGKRGGDKPVLDKDKHSANGDEKNKENSKLNLAKNAAFNLMKVIKYIHISNMKDLKMDSCLKIEKQNLADSVEEKIEVIFNNCEVEIKGQKNSISGILSFNLKENARDQLFLESSKGSKSEDNSIQSVNSAAGSKNNYALYLKGELNVNQVSIDLFTFSEQIDVQHTENSEEEKFCLDLKFLYSGKTTDKATIDMQNNQSNELNSISVKSIFGDLLEAKDNKKMVEVLNENK